MACNSKSVALLMLDYEVGLCEQGSRSQAPALADQIQERSTLKAAEDVLTAARASSNTQVIHVRLAFDEQYSLRTNLHPRFDVYPERGAMKKGSPETAFVKTLAPNKGEAVVEKGCVDPFVGTPLNELLLAAGIRQLVLGGVATNFVVESAARTACDKGFEVTIVEDMCASFDPEMHAFSFDKLMPMFGRVSSGDDVASEVFVL